MSVGQGSEGAVQVCVCYTYRDRLHEPVLLFLMGFAHRYWFVPVLNLSLFVHVMYSPKVSTFDKSYSEISSRALEPFLCLGDLHKH